MTTIRRVFEEFKVDITQMTFKDLYELLRETRDFSDESMQNLWNGSLKQQIKDGQTIEQTTLMCILDTYELVEDEEECLVFDSSAPPNAERDSVPISKVLDKLGILETTELDQFLSISIEVNLKLLSSQAEQAQQEQVDFQLEQTVV